MVLSCKNEVKPEIKTVNVASEAQTSKNLDSNAHYAKAEFTIDGMTCAMGCAKTIEKKIGKMEGVKSSVVDFDKKLAMVEYDEAKITPALLEETVAKVSDTYKVSDMHTVTTFSTEKQCSGKEEGTSCCKDKTDADKKECKEDDKKSCCASNKEKQA